MTQTPTYHKRTIRVNEDDDEVLPSPQVRVTVHTNLYDPDPKHRGEANYVLPYAPGDKWNPRLPATHPFGSTYMADGHVIILNRLDKPRSRPSRAVVSAGEVADEWRIGNKWTVRHDQTNAFLGEYEVVGIVTYDSGARIDKIAGDVPNLKMATATFK